MMAAMAQLDPDQTALAQFLEGAGLGVGPSRTYAIALAVRGYSTVALIQMLDEVELGELMNEINMTLKVHQSAFKKALGVGTPTQAPRKPIFFSLRFNDPTIAAARLIKEELETVHKIDCTIADPTGDAIVDFVCDKIENCGLFLMLATSTYGEQTGTPGCTADELSLAQHWKFHMEHKMFAIRMIPFGVSNNEMLSPFLPESFSPFGCQHDFPRTRRGPKVCWTHGPRRGCKARPFEIWWLKLSELTRGRGTAPLPSPNR